MLELSRDLNIGVVRADVHQFRDGAAALAHGHALEQLTDLVEEHDLHTLAVAAQQNGPHGGHGHEEILVKDLPVDDAQHRLAQHVITDDEIGGHIEQEGRERVEVQGIAGGHPVGGGHPLPGEVEDPALP